MTKLVQFLLISVLFCTALVAQSDTDVLFSVGNKEVTVGEFKYIYTKTNGEAADFSRASLKEYLDLYQRFKLKVHRAYDMKLDTIQSLQKELAGYRRQLADNYLIDRAVTDRLVEELYERMQEDIEISHILIPLKKSATPADTLAAYETILDIKKGLKPNNFADVAKQRSLDKYTKEKGGRVGYLAAPFPKGMYALENAVYDAAPNTVVGPIRTNFGYHLALVHKRRPARGEMEIAHVMVRKPEKGDATKALKTINRAYKLLGDGQPFEQIAAVMSEDKKTSANGGYIGFFGINKYEKAFEEAAFGLTEDDTYSDVVESKVGYHIIRRISKKKLGTLDEERSLITAKVKADSRFDYATTALLASIRKRSGFEEDKTALGAYTALLADSTFFTFKWKPLKQRGDTKLFRIGDKDIKLTAFQEYLQRNARQRVSRRRSGNSAQVAMGLYKEFEKAELLKYAESQLERDYPEFRALMREYEEGILLFEATKIEVWDKASQDSIGLEKFFNANRANYKWKDRGRISQYTIYPNNAAKAEDIRKSAMNNNPDIVLDKYRLADLTNNGIAVKTDSYEKGRIDKLADLPWKAGVTTKLERNNQNGRITFYKIEEILGSSNKELSEARGYVIADYQDQLEQEWVDRLKKDYSIKLRKRVFEKLVRK